MPEAKYSSQSVPWLVALSRKERIYSHPVGWEVCAAYTISLSPDVVQVMLWQRKASLCTGHLYDPNRLGQLVTWGVKKRKKEKDPDSGRLDPDSGRLDPNSGRLTALRKEAQRSRPNSLRRTASMLDQKMTRTKEG